MSFEIDEDFALLYGILLGDGCLSLSKGKRTKKFVVITGDAITDLEFFRNVLGLILKKYRGRDTNIKFRKKDGAIEYNFSDIKLFDFLHSVGFPIGKKGTKIEIPKVFYERGFIKYVIAGFVATDGSLVLTKNPNKYYPRIEAHAICKGVIEKIHSYLNSIGLKGHFYECKRVKRYLGNGLKISPREKQFRFQFNGKENLLLFERLIGFVNPKHKKRFDEFIKYDHEYEDLEFGKFIRIKDPVYHRVNGLFEKKWLHRESNPGPLAHETSALNH